MQDKDLQNATASEPLTLDQEYAMQESWRTDHDKLTFIVCLSLPEQAVSGEISVFEAGKYDLDNRMIGDINLFLYEMEGESSEAPSEKDDGQRPNNGNRDGVIGEIELMIARKDLQRQGYGRAALITFMHYVLAKWEHIAGEYFLNEPISRTKTNESISSLELRYLQVKINQSNEGSIKLFESVGFEPTSGGANYFGEVELRWQHDAGRIERMEWFEMPRMLRYGNVDDGMG